MAALPPRFPCWCRATYSWGGETKKDLGFIEGDLIEALNAGDGLWWMGRLRRDPRAIGLFPSNFVTVLEDSFTPVPSSRNSSPIAQLGPGLTTPTKSKSVFRKPFQAYEELGKRGSVVSAKSRQGTPESENDKIRKEKMKYRPFSSMKTAQAPTSTLKKQQNNIDQSRPVTPPRIPNIPPRRGDTRIRHAKSRSTVSHALSSGINASEGSLRAARHHSSDSREFSYRTSADEPPQSQMSAEQRTPEPMIPRPRSPLPSTYHDGSSYPQLLPASRQPSPVPSIHQDHPQASVSPAASFPDHDSPPPPPPPAHRVLYRHSRAPSLQLHEYVEESHGEQYEEAPSNHSPSPGSNMTPSPLREAMNDVMTSLQDMSCDPQSSMNYSQGAPSGAWSPDAYELVRAQSRNEQRQYPQWNQGPADGFQNSKAESNAVRYYPEQLEDSEQHLGNVHYREDPSRASHTLHYPGPPIPPLKDRSYTITRPTTASSEVSNGYVETLDREQPQIPVVRQRKSAHELGRQVLNRTFTTKTNATRSTNSSSATQSSASTMLTSRSLMSGYSAGAFSATSAGSLARRNIPQGVHQERKEQGVSGFAAQRSLEVDNRGWLPSESSGSGPSYHDSHSSSQNPAGETPDSSWKGSNDSPGILGGLSSPKARRSGFFKKMIATARTTAKTSAANARSAIGSAGNSRPTSRSGSPNKGLFGSNMPFSASMTALSRPVSSAGFGSSDTGPSLGGDWMQVRRDVNRSNSLSRREHDERAERCELHDILVAYPIDEVRRSLEGDEGLDGLPVTEPSNFSVANLSLVDKSARFIQNIPQHVNPMTLAQSYICRPHRTDVQRLRAIFTWVSERITWEEDFEGQLDIQRLLQERRGCSEEITLLVREMCNAVGLHAEVIPGYLKSPGDIMDTQSLGRPNHFWNAVIVDGEWRVMDCALAGPTHPRRCHYSSAGSQIAESWYFLTRPSEIFYTHIPLTAESQHVIPAVNPQTLAALPCACPAYFKNDLQLIDFGTSMLHLTGLEMAHLHIQVPEDIECVAEVEARGFAQDDDGDVFESGDIVRKKALSQAEWVGGRKRFTIKAVLPGDEGSGILKVYAGKRGLMHSIKDNPHAVALALPLMHTGQNPPYDFLTRHPTSHAQRHDLYVAQPQCARLTLNNTFVFCIRQHPSSLVRAALESAKSDYSGLSRPVSPRPYARPTSAMSMVSATTSQVESQSQYSETSSATSSQPNASGHQKPVKLAIQSPSQKIVRLTRKQEHSSSSRTAEEDSGLATSWETVIKVGERGLWRGLVLADRSARWCVFAEWECV